MTDSGRNRGILSTADRDFLCADSDEYSRQAQHAREQAIRERMYDAMLDFTVLFDHLKHDEREKIFGSPNITPQVQHEDSAFEDGLRDAFALILEGTGAVGLFDEYRRPGDTTTERLLAEALERIAWRYKYRLVDAKVDVEAERIPWYDLIERLEDGQEIDAERLGYLLDHDDIDTDEIKEQMRGMLLDGTGDEES